MKVIYFIKDVNGIVKIKRNESCICGSGKKFKKCCIGKVEKETKFLNFISENQFIIDDFYENNLKLQFSSFIPLFTIKEQTLMVAPSSFLDNSNVNSTKLFKEVILDCEMNNKEFNDRESQKEAIDILIKNCEIKFYDLVKDYPTEYLFTLQNMLDYNLYITFIIMGTDYPVTEVADEFSENILNSINLFKEYNFPVEEQLLKIVNLLAMEKQALQKAISFVSSKFNFSPRLGNNMIGKLNFTKLLNTSRVLFELYGYRDTIVSKKIRLKIDGKIHLINNNSGVEIEEKKMNNMMKLSTEIDSIEINEKLSDLVKVYIGLNFTELEKVVTQWTKELSDHNSNYLFFDKISFKEKLMRDFNFCKKNVELFTNYMLNKEFYHENSGFPSLRTLRKGFISYGGDLFGTSKNILMISITGLINDMKNGVIEDHKELERSAEKLFNEKRIMFEIHVSNLLKEKFPHSKVCQGLNQSDIKGLTLPGEIDVIMLRDNQLYIFECKAGYIKYSQKASLNDSKRLNDTNWKKSFQNKLRKKISYLNENIEKVEEFFNFEKIYKINGIIVLKYPVTFDIYDDVYYKFKHFSELEEHIKKLI